MTDTDLQKIRAHASMYVGSNGDPPFSFMEEVLSNAFDEHLAGRARHIEVVLHAEGGVTIVDDGAGISRGTLEAALTAPHDVPTFDAHRPHVHLTGLLRGIGMFVVAALSESFAVHTVHDGQAHSWELARGVPCGPIQTVAQSGASGTRVRFRVDPDIFPTPHLPRAWVTERLEALTDLSPGLRITLRDEGYELSSPPRGITRRARGAHALEILEHLDDTRVHVALAWRSWDGRIEPLIESFVNYQRTRDHGTHVVGMLDGLRDVERQLKPRRPLRERLSACVAVVTRDVLWGEPTHDQLRSPLLRPIVRRAVARGLAKRLEERPEVREALVQRRFRD
jgi:DNA gyrase subunit B